MKMKRKERMGTFGMLSSCYAPEGKILKVLIRDKEDKSQVRATIIHHNPLESPVVQLNPNEEIVGGIVVERKG